MIAAQDLAAFLMPRVAAARGLKEAVSRLESNDLKSRDLYRALPQGRSFGTVGSTLLG